MRPDSTAEDGPTGSSLTEVAGLRLPRVSVVIGCYRQAAYVEAALRSVAAQSYRDFECVAIDDCSADGSFERIEEVLKSLGDDRFRAIARPENGGQMATMMEGLDATSSPFVAFLDADDFWHPAFLERHVLAHMSRRGLAALSCSDLAIVDAAGTQLSGGKPNFIETDPRRRNAETITAEEVLDDETRVFVRRTTSPGWIWSATSGMMFRRTVLTVIRPIRPDRIRICADYYLAKGSHVLGGTVRIERSLGYYRMHGSNGFARYMLLGGRSALGKLPREILLAADEELIARLCEMAEPLCHTLSRKYIANLLVQLAGHERAITLAEANAGARLIMSDLPLSRGQTFAAQVQRHLAGWLAPLSSKSKR